MDKSSRLSGDEWQKWAEKLLQRRYGPGEYQKVPDKHKGDAGIEGFSITMGHAYQAYGPEEPLTTEQRYKKHRRKMTNDIQKFIKNKDILKGLFGPIKIKRWILLVPYFDSKEIVKHAATKTQDVINAELPYIDDDFRVYIEDEEAFAIERDQLLCSGISEIEIETGEVTEKEIVDWADEHDSLVNRLDNKIRCLPTIPRESDRYRFRNEIIKHYLDGQNMLEDLRKYPEAFESLAKIKSQKERHLVAQSLIATGSNSEIFQGCLNDIESAVKNGVRGVSEATLESVAWEAISDWLIRCPLGFPQVQANE